MKLVLNAVNLLLRPVGAQLVRRHPHGKPDGWRMNAMIRRFADRRVSVRTVIDLGASDGKWSIECMKHIPGASFLAVEALEERQAALAAKKARFGNFDYVLCVAGPTDGTTVAMAISDDLDGSTVGAQGAAAVRQCAVRTVDALVKERALKGTYLLKFDTHGYELPILEGCRNALKDTVAIVMEVYNFRLSENSLRFFEMCSELEKRGFLPADLADPMLRAYDNSLWQMDMLFLRADCSLFRHAEFR